MFWPALVYCLVLHTVKITSNRLRYYFKTSYGSALLCRTSLDDAQRIEIISLNLDLSFVFFFALLFMFSLQKVYKNSYEKNRGFSINYCETPKFQMDTVLKQFTDVRNTLKI